MPGIFFMVLLVVLVASFLSVMFLREKLKNDMHREKVALARAKNQLVPRIMDAKEDCSKLEKECEILRMLIRDAERNFYEAKVSALGARNEDRELELFY